MLGLVAGGWVSGEVGTCAKEKAEERAQARWKSGYRGSSGQG